MPKSANTKKYDHKPSGKWQPVKQEKLLKDVKVKHAPPVSSKDIIAKAGANVRAAKPQKQKLASKPVVKKPVSESSSSEDSSSSESESDSQPPKAAINKAKANGKSVPSKKISPVKLPIPSENQKAQRSSPNDPSSDSDSSSNDSSSEDEAPAKPTPVPATKTNGTSKPAESESSSEENSEGDTSDSSAADPKPPTAQKAVPNDGSRDSEDDSSEDDKPKARQIQTVSKSADSSDEESDSSSEDSDSDSNTPPKPPAATLKKAQRAKNSSSDSDSSSNEETSSSSNDEDVEMEGPTPAVTTGKRKAEDSHTLLAKKAKTTSWSSTVTKPEHSLTKTIFIGNLSWVVDNDRLSQEFADCGEVISARVQLDRNTGKSRGFGYVTFATTEAADAAITLNGTKEIDGRMLNLDKSTDIGPNKEKRAQAFGDVRSSPSKVLFVGNLSWNTVEDTLWDAFSEYGEVSSVRLPTDRETGKPKGYGYIEFSVVDSAQKAINAMNGKELDGRPIRLDFSQPRDANGAGRGRGAGFGGGRGRGSFDGGRGRGSGRGRGGDRGRGRGGARGGMRTGAIAAPEGRKTTF